MSDKRVLMGKRPPRGTAEYDKYLSDWAEYKKGAEYAEYLKEREVRKQALKKAVEISTELQSKSVEELNALSDELDKQLKALHEQKEGIHAARVAKLRQDHLDYWGVSQEEYDLCKAKAKESGTSLAGLLNVARARNFAEMRKAQSVKATVMEVGTQAVKE